MRRQDPESPIQPPPSERRPRRAARWPGLALYLAVWTGLALLFAGQSTLYAVRDRQPADWQGALLGALHYWYLWACLAPLVILLGRRAPFDGPRWRRALLAHLPGAVSIAALQVALRAFSGRLLWGPGADSFGTLFVEQFHLNLLVYAGVLGLGHALDYYRAALAHARQASRLAVDTAQVEARLARSELDRLVMQLQPHFLFNTLQAISTLMHEDVKAADRVLTQLGFLLRRVLDLRGRHETTLRQELELLARYVEIQQARFQERLSVHLCAAPETLDVLVPPLVLQPLVENAIEHGVARRLDAGRVEIGTALQDGCLLLWVRDDGPGLAQPAAEGIGLANTRARLAQMYGAAHRLALSPVPTGGCEVLLTLPCRHAGAPG